jgi:hypothetical protein
MLLQVSGRFWQKPFKSDSVECVFVLAVVSESIDTPFPDYARRLQLIKQRHARVLVVQLG